VRVLALESGDSVTEFDVPVLTTLAQHDVEPAAADEADQGEDGERTDASRAIRRIGLVRVGLAHAYLTERLDAAKNRTLLFAAAAALLGAFASLGLVRAFLRPVNRIVSIAKRVGRGEFEAVSAERVRARGELVELGNALCRMADDLKLMRNRLVDANSNLEHKVAARTRELQLAFEELKGLDRLKDDFLSSVSHEFRTPLTSIRSFTEILLKFDTEDPATRREFLGIILTETERLTRLVNDILDLVKIESGGMQWRLDSVDVVEVAENAVKALRPLIEQHQLKVTIVRRGSVPCVRADGDRIHQVVNNLLSNAMKFSHDGGRIEIAACCDGAFVEVKVADHGIGISPKDQKAIFERFRQVGDTLTEKPQGTGLGLPICRNIVERHGGRIDVESVPGKGSTFLFTLPIDGPSESDLRGAPAAERPVRTKRAVARA
jgi:signal transduction histidine kinase